MLDFIKEFEEENYEVVEIFGVPALLFQFRIGNIPNNLFHYDLRGIDYDPGEISTISPSKVCVNFVGTVVLTEKLPITTETTVDINFMDCNAAALVKDGILQYAFNRLYVLNNAANFLCWLKLGTNHYKYVFVTPTGTVELSIIEAREISELYSKESSFDDIRDKVEEMYSAEDADKIISDEELINEIYGNYKNAADNNDSWCYMMRSAITTAVADKGYSFKAFE